MGFLTPFFLLGVGLIAVPVWLHRLHTQSPEREPFGSTMLLEASPEPVLRQRKIRYPLLLALRILLLTLLAFAFAEPVVQRLSSLPAGDATSLQLIVLDTSFSMNQADRLDRAKATAREIIAAMRPGDLGQLIVASGRTRVATERTPDRGALRRALGMQVAGAVRLDLGRLMKDLERSVGDEERQTVIHLISDFQATALPARFGDLVPDALNSGRVSMRLHPVANDRSANWSIAFVRYMSGELEVGVRAYNAPPEERRLTLRVEGAERGTQTRLVQPGAPTVFRFADPELAARANRIEARLTPGDLLAGDDVRFTVIDHSPPAPVLVITESPGGLPVTYIRTALEAGPGGYLAQPVRPSELDPRVMTRYAWIVIDDLGSLTDALADALAKYLSAGGAIFASVGERTRLLARLPLTGHALGPQAPPGAQRGLRAVSHIETSHPILTSAAGWASVRVSRALPVKAEAADRVLIELDGGQPLLIEREVGRGRLLLLTTSLDNAWTDLPVQPVFVGFLAGIARYLGRGGTVEHERIAGESLSLREGSIRAGQVIDPGGRSLLDLGDTQLPQAIEMEQTGFYEVYSAEGTVIVAVNVDPRESDPAPMSPAVVDRWRRGLAEPAPRTRIASEASMENETMKLAPFVLALLAWVVLGESLLASHYLGRRVEAR